MSAGDRSKGPAFSCGEEVGTTSTAVSIDCGFNPSAVDVWNKDGLVKMEWHRRMPVASGLKLSGSGSQRSTFAQADIKGSANTDSENADAASLPTNGALYMAATGVTGLAGTMTPTTQPDFARNVGIFVTNDTGGNLNLYQGITTFTVTGTYKGAAQTELITITSTGGNKAVAHTPNYRYKYGVKPFDTITSVTYDNAPDGTLKLSLGPGSKVGLPNPLFGAVEASIDKITKNAANLSPSTLADTTNNTVNLGVLTNADDFTIIYKTSAPSTAYVTTGGITPNGRGFSLGTDADLNVTGNVIFWRAWKL